MVGGTLRAMRLPDPMLATAGSLPESRSWSFEVKWDGIRCLVQTGAEVRARSRPGRDLTAAFPELSSLPRRHAVLDGELVVLGEDGRPDFEAVRRRMLGAPAEPAVFQPFDLLSLDGRDVTSEPYSHRRALLSELDLDVPSSYDDGPSLFEATLSLGLEGVVAKRTDGRYLPGRRSRHWVKVKHRTVSRMDATAWVSDRGRPVALLAECDTGRARVELGLGRSLRGALAGGDRGYNRLARRLEVDVSHGQPTPSGWLREPVLVAVVGAPPLRVG